MILVHGGGPGHREDRRELGRDPRRRPDRLPPGLERARQALRPFRRNDELLNLLPKGVIAFPGTGITGNLVDKARQLGIPVQHVAA